MPPGGSLPYGYSLTHTLISIVALKLKLTLTLTLSVLLGISRASWGPPHSRPPRPLSIINHPPLGSPGWWLTRDGASPCPTRSQHGFSSSTDPGLVSLSASSPSLLFLAAVASHSIAALSVARCVSLVTRHSSPSRSPKPASDRGAPPLPPAASHLLHLCLSLSLLAPLTSHTRTHTHTPPPRSPPSPPPSPLISPHPIPSHPSPCFLRTSHIAPRYRPGGLVWTWWTWTRKTPFRAPALLRNSPNQRRPISVPPPIALRCRIGYLYLYAVLPARVSSSGGLGRLSCLPWVPDLTSRLGWPVTACPEPERGPCPGTPACPLLLSHCLYLPGYSTYLINQSPAGRPLAARTAPLHTVLDARYLAPPLLPTTWGARYLSTLPYLPSTQATIAIVPPARPPLHYSLTSTTPTPVTSRPLFPLLPVFSPPLQNALVQRLRISPYAQWQPQHPAPAPAPASALEPRPEWSFQSHDEPNAVLCHPDRDRRRRRCPQVRRPAKPAQYVVSLSLSPPLSLSRWPPPGLRLRPALLCSALLVLAVCRDASGPAARRTAPVVEQHSSRLLAASRPRLTCLASALQTPPTFPANSSARAPARPATLAPSLTTWAPPPRTSASTSPRCVGPRVEPQHRDIRIANGVSPQPRPSPNPSSPPLRSPPNLARSALPLGHTDHAHPAPVPVSWRRPGAHHHIGHCRCRPSCSVLTCFLAAGQLQVRPEMRQYPRPP